MNQAVTIVLLIDGDPAARAVTSGTLKGCGCSVIPVRDATDGLETFTAHHTDIALVVADSLLPDMDGFTLLQSLRRLDPRVPVIVMTTADPAEVAQYQHAQVAGVLRKPFRADELVAQVLHTLQMAPTALNTLVVPPTTPAQASMPSRSPVTPFVGKARRDREASPTGPVLHWPPRREDLDAIQVVDAKTLRTVSIPMDPEPPLAPEPAPPRKAAAVRPRVQTPATDLLQPVVPATPRGTLARMPVASASLQTIPRRWPVDAWRHIRANRLLSATAAALCGVAVTTFIEARLSGPRTPTTPEASTVQAIGTAARPIETVPTSRMFGDTSLVRAERVSPRAIARRVTPSFAPAAVLAQRGGAERQDEPMALRKLLRTAAGAGKATGVGVAEHIAKPTGRFAVSAARHLGVVPPASKGRDASPASRKPEREPSRSASARRDTPPPRVNAGAVTTGVPQALPFTRATIDDGLVALRTAPAAMPAPVAARAVATTTTAAVRPVDEQRIYAVLKQYESAYEKLDTDAARIAWPSVDARALARAFGGLKSQELEFAKCDVAMQSASATAVCGGRATYVPRVGSQQRRTESREWTFRLKKVDQSWMIVKAEAR